jgi:hypothetical protein
LVFSLLLGALLAVPATTTAANPITVQVIVGFNCVLGTGPSNARVLATLRTPEGKLRDRRAGSSDEFGNWLVCFNFFLPTSNVNGGDHLRIDVGSKTRFIVVPDLHPVINRVNDTVSGRAAPGTPVDISITHYNGFKSGFLHEYSTTANGSGHFSIDTTGDFDLAGLDGVQIINEQGNDLFGAIATTPALLMAHASNVVFGFANNGTNVHLLLTNPQGATKADVTAGPMGFGQWTVEMFKSDGSAAYPTANDWLTSSIAADAELRMPVSELRSSIPDDMVWGRCPPNAKFLLIVRDRPFYGKAASDGRLVRDVSNKLDLKRGDDIRLLCRYATGDIWEDVDIAY